MPDTIAHDDGDPHAIELEQEPPAREVRLTYLGPGPRLKRRLKVVKARPRIPAKAETARHAPR